MEKEDTVEFKKEGAIDIDNLDQQESIFDEQQEDNPEDSQPEETKTEGDSSQEEDKEKTEEKPQPFHEHPRFKEVIDQRNELKEQVDKLQETIGDVQEKQNSQDLPADWVHLYGDDDASKQLYDYNERQLKTAFEGFEAKLKTDQETLRLQADDDAKKLDEWVNAGVSELKAEGKKFDKNELLKVALDFKPTDDDGNISLRKSLEILENQKSAVKPDNTERKRIAGQTASTPQGEAPQTTTQSTHTLRNKSFESLALGNN